MEGYAGVYFEFLMMEVAAGTHARSGIRPAENGDASRKPGAIRQQTAPEQVLAGLEKTARMLPNDQQTPDRRTEGKFEMTLIGVTDLAEV